MTYTHILFDLDGTLTDPGIGITNSVAYALERYGIHVCQSEFIRNDDGTVTLRLQVRMRREIEFDRALRFLDQNEMVQSISS